MGWKVRKQPISKGKCVFCEQVFAKSGIRAHLESCAARKTVMQVLGKDVGAIPTKFVHLVVEGRDAPEYWMHLEAPADYTLAELDQFLRDIWLECCGHLSQFTIGKTSYVGQPDEDMFYDENEEAFDPLHDELPPDAPEELKNMMNSFKQFLNTLPEELQDGIDELQEQDMNVSLKDVLQPGMKFSHEYDFGSTTELKLTVVSFYDGAIARDDEDPIHVMARNEAPALVCEVCGKPATLICTECMWDGGGLVCNEHATQHSVEMLLPVVNSPRMGVCGYTGDAPDNWNFWEHDPNFRQDYDDWDEDDWDEEDDK